MKKFVLTVIAYIVASMVIAVPWHLIWFKDVYHNLGAIGREDPIIALGMFSMVLQGAVIAYVYPYLSKGGHPVVEGVKITFILGILIYSVMGPATAAKYRIEPISTFLMYHTAFQFIQFTLAGAVIGFIQGRKIQSTR